MDSLRAAAADLVLGAACVGCARPGLPLCTSCARTLRALPFRTWPDPCPPGLPPVWALTTYDGPVRAALVAHKEDGVLALARPLGEALSVAVLGLVASVPGGAAPLQLVPVPSDPATVRARGHDPLQRIAAQACRALRRAGVTTRVTRCLAQRRRVADQAELAAGERLTNLAGAYVARRPGPRTGGWVIVVDDIVTTGATVLEAGRALTAADHRVLGVAVVAATERRLHGSPSSIC